MWKSRLCLSIFGQSHGEAIGMTLDGLPAGLEIDMESLHSFLLRRAPGQSNLSTSRKEEDMPKFISGIVKGKTCGAPITALIYNRNARPSDYSEIKDIPRPSHADYSAHVKYGGFHDYSGGGHFSGRLTAALCIAGSICKQILEKRGIIIAAHINSIGIVNDIPFSPMNLTSEQLKAFSEMSFPSFSKDQAAAMQEEIVKARQEQDSIGGTIRCIAMGLPPGLGDPMFDGMENRIAQLAFAIPAVKGIDFGAGFESAAMRGSEHNDPFFLDGETVKTKSNNHGGILGGITSAMPLVFRIAIKPTPSIGKEQESVHFRLNKPAVLKVQGRHDPCIVPRAVPCVEAVAAIAIYDAILSYEGAKYI